VEEEAKEQEQEKKKKIITIFNILPNLDRNKTKLYINLEDVSNSTGNDTGNDTDIDSEIKKKRILHIYLSDKNESDTDKWPIKIKRRLYINMEQKKRKLEIKL